jgi:hypothetical protein
MNKIAGATIEVDRKKTGRTGYKANEVSKLIEYFDPRQERWPARDNISKTIHIECNRPQFTLKIC